MRIDFHLHTKKYSSCANASLEDQVVASINRGIDVIFVTEHGVLYPQDLLDDINERYAPFKVYQGIEMTFTDDNYEDVVVLGVHDPQLETWTGSYKDLYHFVNERGGVIILAHPYRFANKILDDFKDCPPHAVEVLSSNVKDLDYQRRLNLAKDLGVPCVTNSDSHATKTAGVFANTFNQWPQSEQAILRHLVNGDFECDTL